MNEILNELNLWVVFRLILTLASAWLLITLIDRAIPWLAERVPARHRLTLLASVPVLRLLIILVALFLIVPIVIKPTFENLIAILGALGLALGFAFKDYVSSLVGGVVALFERPYQPGDWIEIDGTYGEVRSIAMRSVRIVTPNDTAVIIPHLKLWDTKIHNANAGSRELLCVADFYLHPNHDAVQVRQKLRDVAVTSPYLHHGSPVEVLVSEELWASHYRVKAYVIDGRDQFRFTTDLTVRGKAALAEMGVDSATIPSLSAARIAEH